MRMMGQSIHLALRAESPFVPGALLRNRSRRACRQGWLHQIAHEPVGKEQGRGGVREPREAQQSKRNFFGPNGRMIGNQNYEPRLSARLAAGAIQRRCTFFVSALAPAIVPVPAIVPLVAPPGLRFGNEKPDRNSGCALAQQQHALPMRQTEANKLPRFVAQPRRRGWWRCPSRAACSGFLGGSPVPACQRRSVGKHISCI